MAEGMTAKLQEQERALIEKIRATNSARVERPASPDPDLILGRIGITYLPSNRPNGFLRLYPTDFIVEEILTDGVVVALNSSVSFQESEDRRTLWIDVIKAAIAGPYAMNDLAQSLQIDETKIGYAGIKDALALTAQRVTLRGVTREQLQNVQSDHLLLRPVSYGNGMLQPGGLHGNRFTIVVRSGQSEAIDDSMHELARHGFLNFFGSQRFGSRLISHLLGQRLLQNDVDGALRMYFGEPGPFDIPLFRDVRLALAESYGDWQGMLDIANHFPFTLRSELKVLQALCADPTKTRAALGVIKDQVKLWVYAYGSWLVNRRFSKLVKQGQEIPSEIALPLAEMGPLPEYHEDMEKDKTTNYMAALKVYPYLNASGKPITARMIPEDLQWKKIPQGWVVRFSLGKGAYATSCLSHVFRLYDALPVPEWAPKEEVDGLREIGDGSLDAFKTHFGPILGRRDLRNEMDSSASIAAE